MSGTVIENVFCKATVIVGTTAGNVIEMMGVVIMKASASLQAVGQDRPLQLQKMNRLSATR